MDPYLNDRYKTEIHLEYSPQNHLNIDKVNEALDILKVPETVKLWISAIFEFNELEKKR